MSAYIENNEPTMRNIQIPRSFIQNESIRKVLFQGIADFKAEEQAIIYMYYCWEIPIKEIAKAMVFSNSFISCVIFLFTERMKSKLELFKKIPDCDIDDSISLKEMLKIEMEEYMTKLMGYQNDEADYKYFTNRQKEIFDKVLKKMHNEEQQTQQELCGNN